MLLTECYILSFKELVYNAGITKPPEIITYFFSVSLSVSFCMFQCSKGHFIRIGLHQSLPRYYLNDLRSILRPFCLHPCFIMFVYSDTDYGCPILFRPEVYLHSWLHCKTAEQSVRDEDEDLLEAEYIYIRTVSSQLLICIGKLIR